MSINSSTILRGVKEYLLITLGIVVYTVGWAIFLAPNNLIGGGVSGISAIIQYATGIKMGYSYFVINTILLIISVIIIGPSFGAKTIYAIVLASACLNLFQAIIPQTIIQDFALSNGKLMCSIIGGSMAGVGIGMSISQGGSTGGTDILAMIITKFRNISPGRIILIIDVFIISSSLLFPSYGADGQLLPFDAKFSIAVYGMIIVTVNGYVVDLYLAGSKQSVQLFVLSRKYEQIADMIVRDFHRGVTVLNGEGWYTKHNVKLLMVWCRKIESVTIFRIVKSIDANALITQSNVSGVYGNGFDQMRIKLKKKKAESCNS